MSTTWRHRARRTLRLSIALMAIALIAALGIVFGGIAAGYRPVVIQTGSMGDTAPPGALVIARPRVAVDVAVGDVLVMRPAGGPTVTHRVIEIEQSGDARFAITKGDANVSPDAAPFPLIGSQLVGRWYLDDWGLRLQQALQPQYVLALLGFVIIIVTGSQLRRIWGSPPTAGESALVATPATPATRAQRRRRRMAIAALPLTAVLTVGVAWAMFRGNDQVGANLFAASDCFDPDLGSVQTGQTIHATDGIVSVPITPVDPTTSFVMATVRSNDPEPVDSTVQVRLGSGGTALEFERATDAGSPPSVAVAWSVVEYACGISVQRGVVSGDGSLQVDVTVADAPPERSFVVASSIDAASATDFGGDDLVHADLTSASNLAIRAGVALSPSRSIAWQIVTFDDPGDLAVQRATATLTGTSTTLTLASPADPRTTFLLASLLSPSPGGADIGARSIRAHLSSPTTVEISRQVAGEPLDVAVQVVTLRDGSTVRHGTVDLGVNESVATVSVDPVDVARATALSTVTVPGPAAGGSTSMVADDVVGEMTATVVVTDPTTVTITRDAKTAAASFGWQVIEWAGPTWWDPTYLFRQRIDVETGSAAAPGGYTVPVTIDHAALVANGIARNDGNDVRVLRWDGYAWTELDRILDDDAAWGVSSATLLFRTEIAIDATSVDSYWLYFGNPAASTPPADAEAVFALVENFDSGTLGDFEDRTSGTAWYQAAPWSYRRRLAVEAGRVGSDQNDFELLVQLTDPALGAAAQLDGSDIRFTAADATTPLAFEIESWDSGTSTLTAWVRIPTVTAASETGLYLYAGAPDAPDSEDVRGTWHPAVDAVWHFADDPAGPAPVIDDSGGRALDGATRGSMTGAAAISGIAGGALTLDGVDDRIDVPGVPLGASGGFTVSAWVRPDQFTADTSILSVAEGSQELVGLWIERTSATTGTLHGTVVIGGVALVADGSTVGTGGWHHLALVFDGSELTVWTDGVAGTAVPAIGAVAQTTAPIAIGGSADGLPAAPFDGTIDEVRIDQRAWPPDRITAHTATVTDPAFVTEGAPEAGSWLGQGTWAARKQVTIDADAVAGPLGPTAVLVAVDDLELAAGARSDGLDIVFTDADGVSRLDHVIESYESPAGSLRAWVLIPYLDTVSDRAIFLYYANPSARDQQDPTAVFGPDADLVLLPR